MENSQLLMWVICLLGQKFRDGVLKYFENPHLTLSGKFKLFFCWFNCIQRISQFCETFGLLIDENSQIVGCFSAKFPI